MSAVSRSVPAAYEGISVALSIEDGAWEDCGLGDAEAIAAMALDCVRAVAAHVELPDDLQTEIGLTLADDATVKSANAEWRGKDRPTNILSFPMAELTPGTVPGPLAGDLLVAFETVAREARAEEKPFADHFRHLLVHGTLHLLGLDHQDDAEADRMEALEIGVLAEFGIPDPYCEAAGTPSSGQLSDARP